MVESKLCIEGADTILTNKYKLQIPNWTKYKEILEKSYKAINPEICKNIDEKVNHIENEIKKANNSSKTTIEKKK
jgi:hypothetical protein